MKLSLYINQLPPGGRSEFAKRIGVATAYLYQMVQGIRPISPKRALSICEASDWQVTPHEVLPDVYPNATDALPSDRSPVSKSLRRKFDLTPAPSLIIKPVPHRVFTPFTGGGYIYSGKEFNRREEERRHSERREAERREQERREHERRLAS